MTSPSVNFFYAGPGLWQYVNLTDAIFEPLAARQVLNSRHWDVQSAKNDALLQTADAYFRVHQYRGMYAGDLYCVERGHDLVDRIAQLSKELVPDGRGRPGQELPRRPGAAGRPRAAGVARLQRRPHPVAPARPPRGGRAAGARPHPGQPDRPLPDARRPDADCLDQPPRDRLAAGARSGGGNRHPPGEIASAPSRRRAQRLPERRHVYPRGDLRPRPQQQPQPVGRPRGREHSAHVAARRIRDRQPRADQEAAGQRVAGHHRAPPCSGHGGGRSDPRPRAGSVGVRPGSSRPTAPCARASSPSTGTSRAWGRPDVWKTSSS